MASSRLNAETVERALANTYCQQCIVLAMFTSKIDGFVFCTEIYNSLPEVKSNSYSNFVSVTAELFLVMSSATTNIPEISSILKDIA